MVKGLANVWVPVEDIKRALGFYRDILGFPVDQAGWLLGRRSTLTASTSGLTAGSPRERGSKVVPS